MKKIVLTMLLSAVVFGYATETTLQTSKQKKGPPFIEYHNRMVVFNIFHLAYERIKPNALYVGVEGWWAPVTVRRHAVAEFEFRMGYNLFYNGRDHFTPIAGVGYLGSREYHHHHSRGLDMVYGTIGFLYDHEFNSVFNLGVNLKGILSGHSSGWGSPVGGFDLSVPITFRFGKDRHWDYRLEPFDIYVSGPHKQGNYFGFRNTFGYRF